MGVTPGPPSAPADCGSNAAGAVATTVAKRKAFNRTGSPSCCAHTCSAHRNANSTVVAGVFARSSPYNFALGHAGNRVVECLGSTVTGFSVHPLIAQVDTVDSSLHRSYENAALYGCDR